MLVAMLVAMAVVGLLALTVHRAAAQTPQTILEVDVADAASYSAVSDAEVMVLGPGRLTRTDWSGRGWIAGLSRGEFRVQVRRIGYVPMTTTITMTADSVGAIFMIQRIAVPLDTITVLGMRSSSPSWNSFEERRHLGIGRFLTANQLSRESAEDLPQVLASHFPGLTVVDSAGQMRVTSMRPACTHVSCGVCAPQVYLDDLQLDSRDISAVNVDALRGVEYYSGSSAPVQYRRPGSDCGVLLLWRREF